MVVITCNMELTGRVKLDTRGAGGEMAGAVGRRVGPNDEISRLHWFAIGLSSQTVFRCASISRSGSVTVSLTHSLTHVMKSGS